MSNILDALESAEYNINHNGNLGMSLARGQLHNAIILLEKGYGLYEDIEPLLEKYEKVEDAPEVERR